MAKAATEKLAQKDEIDIIYMGGIEVDINKESDKDTHDKIVLMDKFIIQQNGDITDIS